MVWFEEKSKVKKVVFLFANNSAFVFSTWGRTRTRKRKRFVFGVVFLIFCCCFFFSLFSFSQNPSNGKGKETKLTNQSPNIFKSDNYFIVGPYSRNPRPVKGFLISLFPSLLSLLLFYLSFFFTTEVVEVFGQVSGSSHKSISSFDRKRELTSRDEGLFSFFFIFFEQSHDSDGNFFLAALKKHPSGFFFLPFSNSSSYSIISIRKKIDAENCSDDKKSKMLNSSATMRKMDRMAKRKSGMESRSVVKRAKSPPTGFVNFFF